MFSSSICFIAQLLCWTYQWPDHSVVISMSSSTSVKNKVLVFTVTQPILFYGADPKVFNFKNQSTKAFVDESYIKIEKFATY